MASRPTPFKHSRLAQEARERYVADASKAMADVVAAVNDRLSILVSEAAPSREMQARRDAWTFYQKAKLKWRDATTQGWKKALDPVVDFARTDLQDINSLELVGTDVVENKIIASRLVLRVMDKVSSALDDFRLRIKVLEERDDLDREDILRPEVLVLQMVEQWSTAGMPSGSWPLINDTVQALLSERLKQAYAKGNDFLIERGVMPTIELKDRVRRSSTTGNAGRPAQPVRPRPDPGPPSGHHGVDSGHGPVNSGPAGFVPSSGARQPGAPPSSGGIRDAYLSGDSSFGNVSSRPPPMQPRPRAGSDHAQVHDETRMMTSATPLARARSRAQGVLGQLKRLLVGRVGPEFEGTSFEQASPALAAAIAVRSDDSMAYGGTGTMIDDYSPAGVARVAGRLRDQTSELKKKAETKGEKATIEIVALMFQAILQEDRIPPGIRVWFARLQMPVLRVALAEPDFFGTASHPARQLIDRMGSCVMGFDSSGIQGGALEKEIKRVVQVIEQYPETGKRVYELVYAEFQKFLQKFLAGSGAAQKVASVAQQVEQKETLTIQYTIEMRNILKDVPVRDEIRNFLFKVWAEVLAVAAVRKGPQHAETMDLKKISTDLIWAASAKPNRADRARVIQDLPKLLQRLRAGMSLLGMPPSQQDVHIKTVSDTLADAFLSKTQAIPTAQIDAMARRLAHLEDFVSEDGMGDLPLDAESIELMLGIDPATIDVVANGGSKPTSAMLAWAQELELGSWFTLDHSGKVTKVQFAWRSQRKQLNLFASTDGHTYLIQSGRLAAYLQAGLLLPQEEEALTVRATRDALAKLEANPERLLN
ncbi:MAG: DUF1631 family protein [Burkholderiaceae bacterium]